MIKKYVVERDGYSAKPTAVCDTFEDAVEVAKLLIYEEEPEKYVHEALYIRSKQTVVRDALYEAQNGFPVKAANTPMVYRSAYSSETNDV